MAVSRKVLTLLLIVLGISAVVYRVVFTRIIVAPGPETSQIIIAARKLEIGTLVKDTDVNPARWVGPVPPGVVLDKEDVVGQVVVSAIYEGEPILNSRLTAAGRPVPAYH